VAAAEDPEVIRELQPDKFMAVFFWRIFHGPGHKVDSTAPRCATSGS
jgi:hypothetical protein